MLAEEKAKQLFNQLTIQRHSEISGWYVDIEETKEHCLVVCDEVIHAMEKHNPTLEFLYVYWTEVRDEILTINP